MMTTQKPADGHGPGPVFPFSAIVGQDEAKATFVTVFGEERAREAAGLHAEESLSVLASLGLRDSVLHRLTETALAAGLESNGSRQSAARV